MEKNRKKIKIAYYCVSVSLALSLGASRAAFALSDTVFYTLYCLLMIGIVAGFFIVNGLWYREFQKDFNALQPILTVEKDPDRYISEIEKLMVGKKSAVLKGMLSISLSAAYCQKNDYEEAKRQLLTVNEKKMHGINRIILSVDFAYVEFCLGNNEAAIACMEQHRRGIKDFENNDHLGGLIAILHIFALLAQGEWDKARLLYDEARPRWESDLTRSDFDKVKEQLVSAH